MKYQGSPSTSEHLVFSCAVVLAVVWVVLLAPPAEAYIDPSAGGMLVQLILAGTAGVAVLGKLFWTRIKGLFGASEPEASKTAGEPDHSHDRV
jgi:hypothetical protein